MNQFRASVAGTAFLLVITGWSPGPARAAGDIVVSVSPASATVGEPVEVLVRTFLPIDMSGLTIPVESPLQPYPVPSGVWNVLYPWADYPFDVVAQLSDGTEVEVQLARDPSDSTIWRGTATLPKPGSWTVWVRNFQRKEVGSTAKIIVGGESPGSSPPATESPATAPIGDDSAAAWLTAGLLLGLLGGLGIGRAWSGRRQA